MEGLRTRTKGMVIGLSIRGASRAITWNPSRASLFPLFLSRVGYTIFKLALLTKLPPGISGKAAFSRQAYSIGSCRYLKFIVAPLPVLQRVHASVAIMFF